MKYEYARSKRYRIENVLYLNNNRCEMLCYDFFNDNKLKMYPFDPSSLR